MVLWRNIVNFAILTSPSACLIGITPNSLKLKVKNPKKGYTEFNHKLLTCKIYPKVFQIYPQITSNYKIYTRLRENPWLDQQMNYLFALSKWKPVLILWSVIQFNKANYSKHDKFKLLMIIVDETIT